MQAILDANAIAQVGLRRYLHVLQGRSRELYPVWDKVLDILYKAEQKLFAQEGRTEEHDKWEKLSPRYAAWKKRHYPGKGILTLTRGLRESMTYPFDIHHVEKRPRRLTWGSHHLVSGGHDLGGIHAEGRDNMLPREPIRITQHNVDNIADTVVDYMLDIDLSQPRQAWEIE